MATSSRPLLPIVRITALRLVQSHADWDRIPLELWEGLLEQGLEHPVFGPDYRISDTGSCPEDDREMAMMSIDARALAAWLLETVERSEYGIAPAYGSIRSDSGGSERGAASPIPRKVWQESAGQRLRRIAAETEAIPANVWRTLAKRLDVTIGR